MSDEQQAAGEAFSTMEHLVEALVKQRNELRAALDAVAQLAQSERKTGLTRRVEALRGDVQAQLGLLDAVLEIVIEDDPGNPRPA